MDEKDLLIFLTLADTGNLTRLRPSGRKRHYPHHVIHKKDRRVLPLGRRQHPAVLLFPEIGRASCRERV